MQEKKKNREKGKKKVLSRIVNVILCSTLEGKRDIRNSTTIRTIHPFLYQQSKVPTNNKQKKEKGTEQKRLLVVCCRCNQSKNHKTLTHKRENKSAGQDTKIRTRTQKKRRGGGETTVVYHNYYKKNKQGSKPNAQAQILRKASQEPVQRAMPFGATSRQDTRFVWDVSVWTCSALSVSHAKQLKSS